MKTNLLPMEQYIHSYYQNMQQNNNTYNNAEPPVIYQYLPQIDTDQNYPFDSYHPEIRYGTTF